VVRLAHQRRWRCLYRSPGAVAGDTNADANRNALANGNDDANSYSNGNTYGDSNGHTDSYTKWWNANSDTYRYAKSNAEAPADAAPPPNTPVRATDLGNW